ncbi:family 20 glycosylhydrolase [Kitasatospora sp. NPDC057015]|uniref:family 20 glycosylhydrolase n=1 Tax=Kitasatospora sp. NPDC057015 TaxID=3346001 RepID=UPI0036433020
MTPIHRTADLVRAKLAAGAAQLLRRCRETGTVRLVAGAMAAALAVTALPALLGEQPAHAATPSSMSSIVPQPFTVQPNTSVSFPVASTTGIYTDANSTAAGQVGNYLAQIMRPSTGYPLTVSPATTAPSDGISLLLTGADPSVGASGYQLDVTATGVVIRAQQPEGLFAGVQTLRQILPAQIESKTAQPAPWIVPGGHVVDHPRFAYRGAMLDVARHFFTVDKVKRQIDNLALYKINYLHLHLTDDQGWRIAINGRPNLTSIGGATAVGGGPGGFYTQADYTDIVAYAASRYVTIVPEIDMPGHVGAALASAPELNCNGVAPPVHTDIAVGWSSLCMNDPDTKPFVDDVIKQIAALTPGPYIAIGGDEASGTPASDYTPFMTWAQQTVVKYGKAATGWHQLAGSTLQPGTLLQYWGTTSTDAATASAAVNGTGLIMSPANLAYLDQKYNGNTVIGLSWAAQIDVTAAYAWDPGTYLSGAPASSIRGIEAALWSESVVTPQDIDYLTFPRLPAYAELGWSPTSTHDITGFKQRLAAQGPRWDTLGIRYYHSTQIQWPTTSAGTGPEGPVTSGVPQKCLDVQGAQTANGTPIILYDCNNTPAQKWAIGDDGSLQALGKCLDATSAGTANGTKLQLWTCNQTPAQKWHYPGTSAGTAGASIVNPNSGRCIATPNQATANFTRLQLFDCNAIPTQTWWLP